jgi:hypothetical protein
MHTFIIALQKLTSKNLYQEFITLEFIYFSSYHFEIAQFFSDDLGPKTRFKIQSRVEMFETAL